MMGRFPPKDFCSINRLGGHHGREPIYRGTASK